MINIEFVILAGAHCSPITDLNGFFHICSFDDIRQYIQNERNTTFKNILEYLVKLKPRPLN